MPSQDARRHAADEQHGKTYRIVRRYFQGHEPKVIATGLCEDDALLHCLNPETSSSTALDAENIEHTKEYGPWFDGYEEER